MSWVAVQYRCTDWRDSDGDERRSWAKLVSWRGRTKLYVSFCLYKSLTMLQEPRLFHNRAFKRLLLQRCSSLQLRSWRCSHSVCSKTKHSPRTRDYPTRIAFIPSPAAGINYTAVSLQQTRSLFSLSVHEDSLISFKLRPSPCHSIDCNRTPILICLPVRQNQLFCHWHSFHIIRELPIAW